MPYKVLGMMRDAGLGKDMNDGGVVPYLTENKRGINLVSVLESSRQLRWRFAPLDTGAEAYLYVMDGNGNIYTAPDREVRHHSSFIAGQPAAAAGMWRVEKGKLLYIDSESGHYRPPGDYCEQILEELKKRGVNLDNVRKDFWITSRQCMIGAKRKAGVTGLKWWQREKGHKVVKDFAQSATVGEGKEAVRIQSGTHIMGQVLRLYPGKKPEWSWF